MRPCGELPDRQLSSVWRHNPVMRLIAITLFLLGMACQAGTIEGRVVGVADGDTITVLVDSHTQHKIRLAGIDAPEKSQPFGQRSKESLSDLVFSKIVTVETGKTDRYGREVGKVLVEGIDANLVQVKRGFAWHYKAYEREQAPTERRAYSDAESAARAAQRGLWKEAEPVPPWKYRKARRGDQGIR